MSDNRPIGIFDSGIGGVSVLRAVRNLLPNEEFLYFGDTGRVPYGSKTPEVITDYSVQIASFLKSMDVKAMIVACNTACARAGKVLEGLLDIPVIGVVKPAAIAASATTKSGFVGVIGTKNTIESCAYNTEIVAINQGIKTHGVACPMLVPYIEEDRTSSPGFKPELQSYLAQFAGKNIDTLILGCTHYPLIADDIREILGSGVSLIDSSTSTAEEVRRLLKQQQMLKDGGEGKLSFYVSGGVADFASKLERFGLPGVHIHQVDVLSLTSKVMLGKAEQYKITP